MITALRNGSLRRLLAAFGMVNVAEWGLVMALSVHAYQAGGALAVGLIGFRLVPGALASLVAPPAPTPRRTARRLSLITLVRTGFACAAGLCLLFEGPFALLVVLVCCDAVTAAPYRPSQAALIPHLARDPIDITAAAAGVSSIKTLAQAVGAVLGGALVGLIDVDVIAFGAAALFVIGAILTTNLWQAVDPYRGTRVTRDRQATRTGMRDILRHPDANHQVALAGLRTLLRGQWTALSVVVVAEFGGLGRGGLGLLNAAAGVGAVLAVGFSVALVLRGRIAAPCVVAFTTSGLSIAAIGVFHAPYWVVGCVLVWGMAMAVSDATSTSLLQRALDAGTVARTVGVMEAIKLALEGIGALVVPGLISWLGLSGALVAAGLPLPVVAVLCWRRIRRSDAVATGRQRLLGLVRRVDLFRPLPIAGLESVAAAMEQLDVPDGTDVIKQDEFGDRVYFIESGRATVAIDGYRIRTLGPGDIFGERGVMRGERRSATVTADGPLRVQSLAGNAFLTVLGTGVTEAASLLDDDTADIIARVPLFQDVDAATRAYLAQSATRASLGAGDAVFEQGDTADAVYVVLRGSLRVSQDGRVLRDLQTGDSFGEIGVLNGTPRTATVRALEEPAVVLRIAAATILSIVVAR